MKKFSVVLGLLVVVGGIVYLAVPKGQDAARALDHATTDEAKQKVVVEVSSVRTVYDLTAENTKIGFSCAKTLAGKTLTVRGGWSGRFGSKLSGKIHVGKGGEVLQVEARIEVGTLWSEHDQLTEALLTRGFFQVERHPTATFVSTAIREGSVEGRAMQDATHVIEGNFTLNGIERSLTFPARIDLSDSSLKLASQFSLRRKEFDVNFSEPAGFGLLTDENISPLVALKLSLDCRPSSATDQETPLAETGGSVEKGGPVEPVATVDLASLPKTLDETIPATQVSFELVLVPGDADQKVPPLYFGRHEVTWDEFMPWVDGRDVEDEDEKGELRALKLRPSIPYGAVDRNFGMGQRPALGMSLLAAELYCKWLSEQTGHRYRLPTEQEWQHAYVLGGGSATEPLSAEDAARLAVYFDTSWDDMIGDYASKPVGLMESNSLGLKNMAGNVCEWVTDTGEERVARGGHFDSPLDELGTGRHVEDQDEWNRDYPNEPKSEWWFVNARWLGFRLVREVEGDALARKENP